MAGKRELISRKSDKRNMRRDPEGRFSESDDVGLPLAADRRNKARRSSRQGRSGAKDR